MIIRYDSGGIRQTSMGRLEILETDVQVYPSGKFFVRHLYADLMRDLIQDMKDNLSSEYDNMIIVEGKEGSGKSVWSLNLCYMYDPDFDLERFYAYNLKELIEKVDAMDGEDTGCVFWLDETINIANKRSWQSENNKSFVDLLVTMRSRGWCLIMCIPRKDDLDFYIREHRFRYVVTTQPMKFPEHGAKDRGYFSLERMNPKTSKVEYIGCGMYDMVSPEIIQKYKEIKARSQARKFEEVKDKILNGGKGGKYKEKYEEERRRVRNVILAMHESGIDREHTKQLFGLKSDQAYYQTLKRARDDRRDIQ